MDLSVNSLQEFSVGALIGKGGFAKVYKVVHRQTGKKYALKVMNRAWLESKGMTRRVENEIKVHSSLRNKNILRVRGHFRDKKLIYLVLDLCPKGNLYRLLRISGEEKKRSKENRDLRKIVDFETKKLIFKQIVQGVVYLHSAGVVHRDLKLSNILVNDDMSIKICDFGLCVKCKANSDENERRTMCGTVNYMAPEVMNNKSYNPVQADLWSLGCLLYSIVKDGKPAINEKKELDLDLSSCDTETCNLIRQLLNNNPCKRPAAKEVLCHPFFLYRKNKIVPLNSKKCRKRQSQRPSRDPLCVLQSDSIPKKKTISPLNKNTYEVDKKKLLWSTAPSNKDSTPVSVTKSASPVLEPIDTGRIRGVQHMFGKHIVQIRKKGNVLVKISSGRGFDVVDFRSNYFIHRGKRIAMNDSELPKFYARVHTFAKQAVEILKSTTPSVILKQTNLIAAVLPNSKIAKVWISDDYQGGNNKNTMQGKQAEDVDFLFVHKHANLYTYDLSTGVINCTSQPKINFDLSKGKVSGDNLLVQRVQSAVIRCLQIQRHVLARQWIDDQFYYPITVHDRIPKNSSRIIDSNSRSKIVYRNQTLSQRLSNQESSLLTLRRKDIRVKPNQSISEKFSEPVETGKRYNLEANVYKSNESLMKNTPDFTNSIPSPSKANSGEKAMELNHEALAKYVSGRKNSTNSTDDDMITHDDVPLSSQHAIEKDGRSLSYKIQQESSIRKSNEKAQFEPQASLRLLVKNSQNGKLDASQRTVANKALSNTLEHTLNMSRMYSTLNSPTKYVSILDGNTEVTIQGVGKGTQHKDGKLKIQLHDGTSLTLDNTASIITFDHEQQSYALLQKPNNKHLPTLPRTHRETLKLAKQIIKHMR